LFVPLQYPYAVSPFPANPMQAACDVMRTNATPDNLVCRRALVAASTRAID